MPYSINPGDDANVTAASGASTGASTGNMVTSESITTAAAATYTLTHTNPLIGVNSLVMASVGLGSSTTGTPQVVSVTPAAGSVVVIVKNIHASAAFNGTLKIAIVAL